MHFSAHYQPAGPVTSFSAIAGAGQPEQATSSDALPAKQTARYNNPVRRAVSLHAAPAERLLAVAGYRCYYLPASRAKASSLRCHSIAHERLLKAVRPAAWPVATPCDGPGNAPMGFARLVARHVPPPMAGQLGVCAACEGVSRLMLKHLKLRWISPTD